MKRTQEQCQFPVYQPRWKDVTFSWSYNQNYGFWRPKKSTVTSQDIRRLIHHLGSRPSDLMRASLLMGLQAFISYLEKYVNIWQIRSENKEKSAVMSFTVTDDLTLSENKEEHVKLAVVCKDGQVHRFEHILNGHCRQPLTSNCTIHIATPGKGKKATPKPIPTLAADFCLDKMSLLLVCGNWFQPTIGRMALNSKDTHICLERDISNCWAPTVETTISKVRTPVMNSEAKALVPGVPGHHVPIKLPPAQPKETENKRKLGSNVPPLEERLGAMDLDRTGRKADLLQTNRVPVLLTQGLERNDFEMLDKVLQTRNVNLRIPLHAVIPL